MTDLLQPSLRAYLEDEDKAIQQAVNELVGELAGKTTVATSWDESLKYSQALLMAAVVRGAYIEELYRLWKLTWGVCSPDTFGREEFVDHTVHDVWNDEWLGRYYYVGESTSAGQKSIGLGVNLDPKEGISVQVWAYNEAEDLQDLSDLSDLTELPGWLIVSDEDEPHAATKAISIQNYLADPDGTVEILRNAAGEMVEALRKSEWF